ncbi:MAG: hypothetical protein KIT56_01760 [Gammaproteobacteria bacterium]|nr:hypothetical protein [Gammaproteobacteria bacterium]MCW5582610.1 hypothetical protein [Gammaproteobacteria bacterium]
MVYFLRLLVTTTIIIFSISAYSENDKEFQTYIPAGWTLHKSIKGDLNTDGKEDAVLILQKEDPKNIKTNEAFGPGELNLNPRRLLILFKTSKGYKPILQNDTFIPSENDEEDPCLSDPLEEGGVGISKGRLLISFSNFSSCGSWSAGDETYIFRYDPKKNDFRLIGQEMMEYMRNDSEKSTEYSWNYMTGKMKITTSIENTKSKIEWRDIQDNKPLYLSKISNRQELDKKT